MKRAKQPWNASTRRGFLKQAAGAAAFVSAIAGSHSALAQSSPRSRTRELFDYGWKFFKGDAPGAQSPAFSDAGWRVLDLPHDWSIEGPFSENEPTRGPGGYLPAGVGWYRKSFRAPSESKGRKVILEFDGVYENSEVWINGDYLGKRPFGYISFAYDLTPHLNSNRDNVIAVKVDNSRQPNSRWYSGSGIYRHTWLLTLSPVHIGQWGVWVTTPRVTRESASVRIKTQARNESASAVPCVLTTSVLDRDGKPVQASETSHQLGANSDFEFVQQMTLDQPQLWGVETPYLYTLRSIVRVGERVVDETETQFGVREALFDADRGFLLNGVRVKLNGVCLHHDGGAVGAAVPERVWERRLSILKEMGCNAIRTSHNPVAPEFLDLCDSMGFLVMNEAFDEWRVPKGQIGPNGYSLYFDEWSERDVKDFVHRDRNHPSVVLWSAGNEIGDQLDPRGVETLRCLIDLFHREDPTRLVTAGCDQISAEPRAVSQEFLDLLDVVGYNYVDRWRDRIEKYYSIDRAAYPRRRVIGTESSGMGGPRGDYAGLIPGQPAAGPFGAGRGNRKIDVEQLWKFVSTYDYVAGDFMWTGIDYLGESRWPGRSSSAGVLDTCGFKKDGFYFYQSQWTSQPMLHLFPHWNWKGLEGQFIPVTCYTNCDTVELFLNGRSIGSKGYCFPRQGMSERWASYPARARVPRTTGDLHLSWDVPYEPGTLKAVGTRDGKVAVQVEVSTTGEPAALMLSADRNAIRADWRDVAHFTVQAVDSQGRLVPDADNEVFFDVQGEGRLIGVDNGDPASHEDFKANRRKAFHGLCLAIVQATDNAGEIKVTATGDGLTPATVTLSSR